MAPASPHMNTSGQQRPSTFLWQGLLIVLPVLVLAAVGLFSLRQDKLLVQHEAAERAQNCNGASRCDSKHKNSPVSQSGDDAFKFLPYLIHHIFAL